ncbi:MAG: hypothetical protein MKZ70_00210, partial [Opitutales bacterium]|nr:hypothetical protein [Opitutales bacterium]
GGRYLWLRSPKGLQTGSESECDKAGLDSGVFYVPGDLCFVNNAQIDYIRASFGVLSENQLEEAAERFNRAAASVDRAIAN